MRQNLSAASSHSCCHDIELYSPAVGLALTREWRHFYCVWIFFWTRKLWRISRSLQSIPNSCQQFVLIPMRLDRVRASSFRGLSTSCLEIWRSIFRWIRTVDQHFAVFFSIWTLLNCVQGLSSFYSVWDISVLSWCLVPETSFMLVTCVRQHVAGRLKIFIPNPESVWNIDFYWIFQLELCWISSNRYAIAFLWLNLKIKSGNSALKWILATRASTWLITGHGKLIFIGRNRP